MARPTRTRNTNGLESESGFCQLPTPQPITAEENQLTYKKINGVIPILQTPFLKDGGIDTDGIRAVIDYNIDAGVDGLGIALASEVQLFNEAERDLLIKTVVDQTNGRVPVVMNTGAPGTDLAIFYSKRAEELGVDAVMLTPPGSGIGSSNPENVRQYFRSIANAVNVSVVLQDVQFAQVDPQMVAELASELPGIVACKMETPPTALASRQPSTHFKARSMCSVEAERPISWKNSPGAALEQCRLVPLRQSSSKFSRCTGMAIRRKRWNYSISESPRCVTWSAKPPNSPSAFTSKS